MLERVGHEPTRNELRRRRRQAGRLARGGALEFATLLQKTQSQGVVETAGEELEREQKYVADADGALQTLARAGQTGGQLVGVMLTITLAAAIGFVGVKVNSEVEDSITDKDLSSTNAENQTIYENTSESISGGFTDAMGLTDIVFLVLMFSVVLGALLAFRSAR